jgi:CRP-like cAMP-binding protein
MPETDARAALAALDVFEGVEDAVLDRLAMLARPFTLAPDEYLFHEGDPGDRISLLASGEVQAIMRLPGGRELESRPVRAGELIGEMTVLSQRPRRFSVRASEPTEGWTFVSAEVGRLGVANQHEVMGRFGQIALHRLRDQYARLERISAADPRADEPAREARRDPVAEVRQIEPEPDESAYLETVLFFSHFSVAELEELFGGLRRLEAPRGATVIAAGEPASALLIVIRGAVETSIRRGGLVARARLAGPGRIVGHLGLLEGVHPASSLARERSILLELPVERAREIFNRGDDLGERFGFGVYADIVDALFDAQRPISAMAAVAVPAS